MRKSPKSTGVAAGEERREKKEKIIGKVNRGVKTNAK